MLDGHGKSGSSELKATILVIGLPLLVLLGLLVGIPASHAFRLPSSLPSTAPREPAPQAQHSQPAAGAPGGAAPQENARPQVEESGQSGGDDPQQIENFQDLIVKGAFQEVEPLLHTYLAAHPRSWKAYYFLGYVLLRERRIADSVKALSKSLELNVNNAAAHRILGRELTIIGRYDLALREFDQALLLDPNSAEVYYNRGRVYSIQDDFPRAKKEFEKAIELDPAYMEAYNALGFAMEALGDDAAALEDYQNAMRLNEQRHRKFDAPYVNISGYYNRRGNLDLAVEYAQRALELNPQSDLAYFQIGKACRTRRDWKGEVEAMEKAAAIKASSAQYHYVLGVAYRKLGRIKESEQAYKTFQQLEKQSADMESKRREARRARRGLELRPEE
jgi:tetratricopeptide (TPR) repeat protein